LQVRVLGLGNRFRVRAAFGSRDGRRKEVNDRRASIREPIMYAAFARLGNDGYNLN
jgi:hypothetical protein